MTALEFNFWQIRETPMLSEPNQLVNEQTRVEEDRTGQLACPISTFWLVYTDPLGLRNGFDIFQSVTHVQAFLCQFLCHGFLYRRMIRFRSDRGDMRIISILIG